MLGQLVALQFGESGGGRGYCGEGRHRVQQVAYDIDDLALSNEMIVYCPSP